MSQMKIQNFGPIKQGYTESGGFFDIKKVSVFIGNQGTGKSIIAKLIAAFTWIEKALVRGDYDRKWFERKGRVRKPFLGYHRLENYNFDDAVIEYRGEAYSFVYKDDILKIDETNGNYELPQIMYVPAERNFISYVKTPKELKISSASLLDFLAEFDNAKLNMKQAVTLPINNVDLEYDRLNDILNLRSQDYKIKLMDASSGFQSFVPLYLVSDYLANSVGIQGESKGNIMTVEERNRYKKGIEDIWKNENLTDEQRSIALSTLTSRFNKSVFVNIVEEPEQNLFPNSQRTGLTSLIKLNNMCHGNKLLLTTHSPYIINFLCIAIQADILKNKINTAKNKQELLEKLEKVMPAKATISANDVAVYQLNDEGIFSALSTEYDIPSDNNYLNDFLKEGNELFDALLEIEEEIQS
jgi:predicted ATPase